MPVSPVVRRAWTWGGGVAAAALLVWGGANAVGVVAHEEETVVSRLGDVPYEVVEVRAEREVRVLGVAGRGTTITADITNGLRGPDHGFRLEGRRLLVWGDCPQVFGGRCAIALTVEVPAGVQVVARAEHGEVTVSGLRGAVDARSEHGDVEARDLSGPLLLETEHGDVVAEDVRATTVRGRSEHGDVRLRLLRAPREAVAESEHGDVEVIVPAVAGAYRVETDTEHGTARADVREDPFSPRSVTARTEHGDAVVRYP